MNKDLIIKALDIAAERLAKATPKTKTVTKSMDVSDVAPKDLYKFMQENNVPDTAYFDVSDNGYDGWDAGTILLSWYFFIPTTQSDSEIFAQRKFQQIAFRSVHEILTQNGYMRVGFNSALLKDYRDAAIYNMYKDKDFDRLAKYYSMYFIPATM